jgi:hypothetical protein
MSEVEFGSELETGNNSSWRHHQMRWRLPSAADAAATGLLLGGAIWIVMHLNWSLSDMAAYDHAAARFLAGGTLYPALTDPTAPDVYRYAPWFAVAWLPMHWLAEPIRGMVWSSVLVVASVAAAWPLLIQRRVVLVAVGAMSAAWLLGAAKWGNVEPLMIAVLVWGTPRRWGPVAVGVAASLKVAPILLAVVWFGRGEWRKASIAIAVAAILLAPMLLSDLSHYPLEATATLSVRRAFGEVAWAGLTIALTVGALVMAKTRWSWWLADAASLAAYPQLPLYRLGMLLVGTTTDDQGTRGHDAEDAVGARRRQTRNSGGLGVP